MTENRTSGPNDVTCRLERSDGSTWQVIRLDLFHNPPSVTAMRDDPTASGERDFARLEREPLTRGDRLVWLDRRGEVVWALRSPL